ncbi:hypothetical protein KSS87_021181 [Heliosperma pusillum]|nr:hypothetical protein KSS87_021181 [Heliosperma pusillum]
MAQLVKQKCMHVVYSYEIEKSHLFRYYTALLESMWC